MLTTFFLIIYKCYYFIEQTHRQLHVTITATAHINLSLYFGKNMFFLPLKQKIINFSHSLIFFFAFSPLKIINYCICSFHSYFSIMEGSNQIVDYFMRTKVNKKFRRRLSSIICQLRRTKKQYYFFFNKQKLFFYA